VQAQKTLSEMPRNAIYVLLTKNGPSEGEQVAFVEKAIGASRADAVYVDDLTSRRRKRDHQFPERDMLLRQLRPGDKMAIATPGRLGIGREDIRAVLHKLRGKCAPLVDASTGRTIVWSDDVADSLSFFDRAVMEHKHDVARAARAAKAAMGITYVPKPKRLAIPEDEARMMWRDTARYPSAKIVAEHCKVTVRTLYTRFGKRNLVEVSKKVRADMKAPAGHNYVYIMSRRDGLLKIGFSTNPEQRKRELSALLRQPLRLRHCALRPGDAYAAEQYAHWILLRHHRGGEWFETNMDAATGAIAVACKALDTRNLQERRLAIVEAAEANAGHPFSRQEIKELFVALERKDETDV
jgi:hypothetical protein